MLCRYYIIITLQFLLLTGLRCTSIMHIYVSTLRFMLFDQLLVMNDRAYVSPIHYNVVVPLSDSRQASETGY